MTGVAAATLGRTFSQNEQLRESYAILPAQLQDLPDLKGYLKIGGYPAASVKVKVKRFPVRAKRFVEIHRQKQTIQQQWQQFV